jgi:diguanylate cyclase
MAKVATGVHTAQADIATRIALAMRKLGIAGLPRNYELVYEAYAGSNVDLSKDLAALGANAPQQALDALSRKYFVEQHGEGVVADAQQQVTRNLEECLKLLRREQSMLENYGKVLDEATDQLNNTDSLKVDIIQNFIKILTTATDSTIDNSKQTINMMVQRSDEIERVRSELSEYKRMAHTDVLTQLSNRRAFDDTLARIYDDPKNALYFALVIADIDHFKRVNDTFGHPVGDKVIKLIGSLFRAALRRDVFIARTGGEEFAFVLAGTTERETMGIANRIRESVEKTPFVNQRNGVDYGPITLSMGVCMAADAENAEDLYRKADLALYASKHRGRNLVTMHTDTIDDTSTNARVMYRQELG